MPKYPESVDWIVYNIIPLDTVGFAPGTHDKRVVESNDCNNIDAFRLNLGEILDIAWQMLYRATWGESSYILTFIIGVSSNLPIEYIPGTAKTTAFLSANSLLALYAWGTPQDVISSFSSV